MFISEIPVRCTHQGEKQMKWISNLNSRTTAREIITSIFPACDPAKYFLYIHVDRKKQLLKDSVRIYKVVAKINQQKSSRRLFFEIQHKKRVRFADEIIIQTISQGQCLSKETVSVSFEKRLEAIKEKFRQHIHQRQQEHHHHVKR